ncbi:CLUMA_CG020221, isoform A [Clunio marinus]|uniref:CLUMA_CG020221, isoform A n=1 Tax=Clunio marinus TaxID=568069 RepID=A0A1J1J8L2_9DIPT|nr:CLUMA_CG020221, isoform A [Clunio marinus]
MKGEHFSHMWMTNKEVLHVHRTKFHVRQSRKIEFDIKLMKFSSYSDWKRSSNIGHHNMYSWFRLTKMILQNRTITS